MELLNKYWSPENQILVQVGDMVDRGNFPAKVLNAVRDLEAKHPEAVISLMGNHERELIEHLKASTNPFWLAQGGITTVNDMKQEITDLDELLSWLKARPMFYETDHIFVSHAGISKTTNDPFDYDSCNGVLWTREPLKDLGKTQVVGHTPTHDGKPRFDPSSNTWYIDTWAYHGKGLCGAIFNEQGQMIEWHVEPTSTLDIDVQPGLRRTV
ncbi:MAG: serine/threonine protein phosphatase [Zetaproteobacteria bacterium]|nr:serine/threonine protein phosphatase [Pseudobdellovibrionaceae bacterium]